MLKIPSHVYFKLNGKFDLFAGVALLSYVVLTFTNNSARKSSSAIWPNIHYLLQVSKHGHPHMHPETYGEYCFNLSSR
jgi:hypothetical protein